jgi:phosphoribosylanthranilate isomerase
LWIKICGITSVEDARLALDAGADAVGVNLVESSPRVVDFSTARSIAAEVEGRARAVAVVADLDGLHLRELRRKSGIEWLQLHGSEDPATLEAVLPNAYKALRIAKASDVAQAERYSGDVLLVDAKVPGLLGGSGRSFDWQLVKALAHERKLLLAGGLGPDNVAEAIRAVRPHGVDVASGVERANEPRRKDGARLARFIEAARRAASEP